TSGVRAAGVALHPQPFGQLARDGRGPNHGCIRSRGGQARAMTLGASRPTPRGGSAVHACAAGSPAHTLPAVPPRRPLAATPRAHLCLRQLVMIHYKVDFLLLSRRNSTV